MELPNPEVELPNPLVEHIAHRSSQHTSTSQEANSSCTEASPKPPQLVVQLEEEEELRTLELGAGILVVVLRIAHTLERRIARTLERRIAHTQERRKD